MKKSQEQIRPSKFQLPTVSFHTHFTHQLYSAVHPVWKPFRPLSLPPIALSISPSLPRRLPLPHSSCLLHLLFLSLAPFPPSPALHFVFSRLPSPVGTARASALALCGTLARRRDSSRLGKGSETFCKWGEMTPLVSNLVPLVSGISLRRARRGGSLQCYKENGS